MNKVYIKHLLFLTFILILTDVHSQLSKTHYIPPVTDNGTGSSIGSQYIYISTPSNSDVAYTITPIGNPLGIIQGFVSNANPVEISIGSGTSQLVLEYSKIGDIIDNKGYYIEANDVIYVSVRLNKDYNTYNRIHYQAGALVSKGLAALGQEFRVGTFTTPNPDDGHLSFFSIMATEDNTNVVFEYPKSAQFTNLGSFPPGAIILQEFETYTIAVDGFNNFSGVLDQLIGTLIQSDKPIVVNCGSANGSFSESYGGRDVGIDQIVGASRVGKEYIFIKGDGYDEIENALIVAHYDNTQISVNGTLQKTIDKGEYYSIEGELFDPLNNNMYVETSEDVFAFQGTGKFYSYTSPVANQGLFFVPPLSCENRGNVNNIAAIDKIGNVDFDGALNLVVNVNAVVKINDIEITNLISSISVDGPNQVPGNTEYETYTINGLEGDISVSVSMGELYCSYYNRNGPATSGSFYSGFPVAPEINFKPTFEQLGNCIPNIVLESASGDIFDSYKWMYDDGTGFVDTGITSSQINPTNPGKYKLIGTINCSGINFESAEVPVSICPSDSDSDGIIDNIDLDSDNDGILNELESLGNGIINLTDELNPTVTMEGGGASGIVATGTYTSSSFNGSANSFSGDSDGNFTSFIDADPDAEGVYLISFDKLVNVAFKPTDGTNHTITNGERFSVQVIPSDKNITVLNEDNHLLIDTDYDGEYESGVDNFTNSEIRFVYNSNAVGDSYIFYASQVDAIKFTHVSTNSSISSTYEGHISLYELSLDTDGDGSFDAFDNDSDNDGCFDVIEAGFEDADSNGVLGTDPVVFDNRGRVLDSGGYTSPSNANTNGIYDFQEVGTVVNITTQPATQSICAGENVTFSVATDDANSLYQWQVKTVGGTWEDISNTGVYSNSNTETLVLSSVPDTFSGNTYRVAVNSATYQCKTMSMDNVVLNINAVPQAAVVEPVQTFCNDGSPTVADLTVISGTNIEWYDLEVGGVQLSPATPLIHNKAYYALSVDTLGCESTSRTETTVFISDPDISVSDAQICVGESTTLTVNGIPQTPQDFINAHPELTKIQEYNGAYYFVKQESMSWEDANILGDNLEGTSMYIINDINEEQAVYSGIQALGFTGDDNISLWFGLKQNTNAVGTGTDWFWVDGSPLVYENWADDEPNDCCDSRDTEDNEENYGQFEFSDNGMQWNDIANNSTNGNSWPVFEFTGTTNIVWGYYDPLTGNKVQIPNVNTSSYEVSPTETTTYYIEVTTNNVVCEDSFQVIVDPLPVSSPANDLRLCDDDTDGFEDNGIVQKFLLNQRTDQILGTLSPANYSVTYHKTPQNAIDNFDPIDPDVFYENTSNPQIIYVRLENNTTNCFVTDQSFKLVVDELPFSNPASDIILCDNTSVGSDTDGFINSFDLEQRTAQILGTQAASGNFEVTYHLSSADANDETKLGLSSPFQNTVKDGQPIFIRVTNKTTGCFSATEFMNLVVAPLPVLSNNSIVVKQCDDDATNDGVLLTNLTEYEDDLSVDAANESFEYFEDATYDPSSKILDPTQYENTTSPYSKDIHVKIQTVNGCERTAIIELRIGANLIDSNFMESLAVCDDSPATNQDGIAVFPKAFFNDLRTKIMASNPKFSLFTAKTTFYESEIDALTKMNPIDETVDYTNSTPSTQEIWANIENTDLGTFECIGLKQVATLTVETLPIAHPVAIPRQCDDDQDGAFPFDTSSVETQLLMGQTGVTIYYTDQNGNPLPSPLPNPFLSTSQIITIKVENNPSGGTPPCFDTTTLEFIVDDSPEAYPVVITPQCDDGLDDTDGYSEFDTSTIETDLLGGQTGMTVTYRDQAGNTLPSPLPNPFNTKTQKVTATITNPINTACNISIDIDFVVNPLPVFDVDGDQIVCLNLTAIPLQTYNVGGTYTYKWTRTDSSSVTTPLPDTTRNIYVNQGGVYTVTATATDGTNCERSKTILVEESNIAYIDLDAIQINDLTNNGSNNIVIDTTDLGIGDYEFSLDDPLGPYQDAPLFENVKPGIHKVYVQDKNNCGITDIEVSVLGYPKYFTPNGDGFNDRWNILGVTNQFQSNSRIYIFDRYGKLLKELAPLGNGWDGIYLGKPLPASDYWFRVYLDDGREFKGHFTLKR